MFAKNKIWKLEWSWRNSKTWAVWMNCTGTLFVRGARLATLTRRQSHLQSFWRTFSIRMLVLARSTLQSLLNSVNHKCGLDIPKFTMLELQRVMRQLKNRKCADADGLVAEMFKHGNSDLMNSLLELYNNMLDTGRCEPTWQHTIFTMLPKKWWQVIAEQLGTHCDFEDIIQNFCSSFVHAFEALLGSRTISRSNGVPSEHWCGRCCSRVWIHLRQVCGVEFGILVRQFRFEKTFDKISMTLYSEPYLNKAFVTHIWSCWPPYITTRQDVFTAVRTYTEPGSEAGWHHQPAAV